jgi:hypothetical protein
VTPKQWKVVEPDDRPGKIYIYDADRRVASFDRYAWSTSDKSAKDARECRAFHPDDRAEAIEANRQQIQDITLMAAAPELLASLKALVACIDMTRGPDADAALQAAKAAIAKAEGGAA